MAALDAPSPRASLEIVLLPVDRPGLAELTRDWGRELGRFAGSAAAHGLLAGRGWLQRMSTQHGGRADDVGGSAAVPVVSPAPDQPTKLVP